MSGHIDIRGQRFRCRRQSTKSKQREIINVIVEIHIDKEDDEAFRSLEEKNCIMVMTAYGP